MGSHLGLWKQTIKTRASGKLGFLCLIWKYKQNNLHVWNVLLLLLRLSPIFKDSLSRLTQVSSRHKKMFQSWKCLQWGDEFQLVWSSQQVAHWFPPKKNETNKQPNTQSLTVHYALCNCETVQVDMIRSVESSGDQVWGTSAWHNDLLSWINNLQIINIPACGGVTEEWSNLQLNSVCTKWLIPF